MYIPTLTVAFYLKKINKLSNWDLTKQIYSNPGCGRLCRPTIKRNSDALLVVEDDQCVCGDQVAEVIFHTFVFAASFIYTD